MTLPSRARAHDRLAELVVVLSGARHDDARTAIDHAIDRNGDAGDNLINVADAVAALRNRARTPTRGTGDEDTDPRTAA